MVRVIERIILGSAASPCGPFPTVRRLRHRMPERPAAARIRSCAVGGPSSPFGLPR